MNTPKLQISDWFLLEHEKMEDNFPDLPSEQEGGSSAINAAAPPSAGPKSANSKKPAKTAPSGGKGTLDFSANGRLDALALLFAACSSPLGWVDLALGKLGKVHAMV